MRLNGLGISDTDVLQPGSVVSFVVHSRSCSGVYEADIRNTLNNWLSQMMNIVSVTTTAEGYIPTVVDVEVTATVSSPIPAGQLRGQIMASLAALSASESSLNCGTLALKDGVLNYAAGGTNPAPAPGPTSSGNLFGLSTTSLILASVAAAFGVVLLARK